MKKEIARIGKNSQEDIIIQLTEFKGIDLVDLRVWVRDDVETESKPTKKGLTIKPELLPELIEALQQAEQIYQGAQDELYRRKNLSES